MTNPHEIDPHFLEYNFDDYQEDMDQETFAKRYAGVLASKNKKRLSKSSIKRIWGKFIKEERLDFFAVHTNLTEYDVARVGADKFIYTIGWTKPAHIHNWRKHKVRIGICCHCDDQFVPMMLQTNHGLCNHCRPLYSSKAMQQFVLKELNGSERYFKAHRDMLMDFFIMFYNDPSLRVLFLKDSEFAKNLEAEEIEKPDWLESELTGEPPVVNPDILDAGEQNRNRIDVSDNE